MKKLINIFLVVCLILLLSGDYAFAKGSAGKRLYNAKAVMEKMPLVNLLQT